jgi:hypothetical protein
MKFVLAFCSCTNIDVYSPKSWQYFEEEKKKKLERKEDDVVSLSSDDEPVKPVPSVRLRLQCDAAPVVDIRVQKVKFLPRHANVDHDRKNAG